ncbi:hypothetical protein [Ruminococcus sp.]|uniref:hypothetical protein n=1 Tax=Ruminococcus sp. TaxID=41978 RepID=UPI00388ED2B2
MHIPNNIIKSMFQNVYFITGTAYAGKSTAVKLLAERFDGICCGENYHDVFMKHIDKEFQPNLAYFDTMKDWQEFISRTPDEYANWIDGCSKEAESLESIRLFQLVAEDKKIFVDTNISLETLREISDYQHIAVLLCPQSTSVDRFFDRGDSEKMFILDQINQANNPEQAMANYRKCLEKINSKEVYEWYANSGFYTLVRDGNSTIENTIDKLALHFGL